MVADERRRRAETKQRQDAVLASAPAAVRAAFERKDVAALRAALAELPDAEAAALVQRLQEAGLIRGAAGPDMTQVLNQFEPLLQAIAAATKDESQREPIGPVLTHLEENGWRLTDPVHRIWAGERDAEALTAGIDGNSAQLVRRILELLGR